MNRTRRAEVGKSGLESAPVGFIGYLHKREGAGDEVVRIFLECREDGQASDPAIDSSGELPRGICYTYAVDVVFPGGKPPRLQGVDGILVLKKFYKLVHSLEERAREHGNDWQAALGSVQGLLEHLAYTRNARNFTNREEPMRSSRR